MAALLRYSTKAAPCDLVGAGADALIGRNIFDGSFPSPLVVARADAIKHNLATMSEFCRLHGAQLAPHAKTTMSPALIIRQIAHGAWGVTVANAVQARTLLHHGVRRILIANQLINEPAITWAFDAVEQGLDLYCFVDSIEGLDRLNCVDRLDRDRSGRISVLVEIGRSGGRSGVRSLDEAIALADQANAVPSVRCAGIAGYEGVFLSAHDSAHDHANDHDRQAVQEYLRVLAASFERIAGLGLFEAGDVPVVTAGGSACFHDVVNILGPVAQNHGAELVLRSGCYITHDDGFYRRVSPLRSHPDLPPLRPALEAIAQVTSRPEPALALVDLGKRDVSFDEGLPVPLWRRHRGKRVAVPNSWRVSRLMDQHGFLAVDPKDELAVGDLVSFGISHPCTTFDKWTHILEVGDDGTIVAVLSTEF